MLYYLHALSSSFFPLNLFKYVTFRAGAAAFTAFVLAVLMGPWLIRRLRALRVTDRPEKNDSKQLDEMHRGKKDTPTMGGVLIVGGTLLAILLWAAWPGAFLATPGERLLALSRPVTPAGARVAAEMAGGLYAVLAVAILVAAAALGFVDDYIKLRGRKGLRLWTKLFFQVAIALAAALVVRYALPIPNEHADRVYFPFVSYERGPAGASLYLPLGAAFVIFAILVMVGSSNAVNLADGLDGLAGGCAAVVAVAYAVLCYVASNARLCDYLFLPFVQGSGELAVCAAALGGACLGFLWYNCHPAEVFMGDTGSLPVGALIGYTALVCKHELLLVLVGGVFVAEALSVLLQIASFRLFGKRVFKIAPLHHHFEFLGWPENKVVVRFWIAGVVLALASIATLKIR